MKSYKPFNLRRKAVAVAVATAFSAAQANPVSPTVVHGMATFNQQGSLYTITNTPNTIIDWRSFSINPGEMTRFVQQSADSKVLNRITGQDPSAILGALQSNGKVFLINPNGVIFGAGSRVDVNGLVASSLDISNADFLAGKNNFDGAANAGKVSNQGTITTPAGGQIFLVAPAVENSGIITTEGGQVVLAAGHSAQLFDSADPNVQVVVSSPADQALNLGQIVAASGRVGVYGALVNQRGSISADSAVVGANGKIVLKSSKTTLLEAGSVTSARGVAEGGDLNTGSDIQLLGPQVGLTGNAVVDASGGAGGGTVLVGGDYQGKNPVVINAQQSYVGQDAVIKADATVRGDGGKVIVWGDKTTQMYGAISARGGAQSGNGGFVETSGHYLDMLGRVDTRAPLGTTGKLLMDPSDVYIATDLSTAQIAGMTGSGSIPISGGIFVDTAAVTDSLLLTSMLTSSLASTDVTVSTNNSAGVGTGVIKVVSPLAWISSHTLTLNAVSDIRIDAPINALNAELRMSSDGGAIVQSTSPSNALQVRFVDALAAGAILLDNTSNTIGSTASLVSQGSNVTFTAQDIHLGDSAAFGTLNATASNGDLTVSGNVSAGGNLSLMSSKPSGQLTIDSGVTVSSSGGNITLQADRMSLNGAVSGVAQREVRLQPYLDSTNVLLGGSAADTAGTLGLSEAELQNISVPGNGLLSIGPSFTNTAATGSLTVDGSLNLSSSLGGGAVLLQGQAAGVNINSGAVLAVPSVLSLHTVPTGDNRITNAGSVSAGSGIDLIAGKMTLAGGTLSAPALSLKSGNDINLGATGNPANTLALTSADLNSASTSSLNVSINSSHSGTGDIVASVPLTVTPNLTLTSQRNIDLQSSVSATGNLSLSTPSNITAGDSISAGGTFTLQNGSWTQNGATLPAFSAGDFKISGGSFVRALGGDGGLSTPYRLADVYGLQGAVSQPIYTAYVLANDVDARATTNWSNGFQPLASSGYTGVFDGAGHVISGLNINRGSQTNVGLFSSVATGTIRDLTLSSVNVQGGANVGALAGYVTDGVGYISNVQVSGQVSGVSNVGGLIGSGGGIVRGSSTSGTVNGLFGVASSNIGGLVGRNTGLISDSSSSASVSNMGDGYTGGLVGANTKDGSIAGSITRSFAAGAVYSIGEIVGGLVGDNNGGSVSLAYASGAVNGGRNVGGLAGRNINGASITNAYATGNVSGNFTSGNISHGDMGGLIGDLYDGTVSNVYSSGTVSGSGFFNMYGAVGAQEGGTLSNAYFNKDAAGVTADVAGATGLSAADTQRQSNYAGLDFTSVWRNYDGHTAPLLKNFLTQLTVNVTGGSVIKTYDGQSAAFTGTIDSLPSGVIGTIGFEGAVNAGVYNVGGLWSTQYDISYTGSNAQLTIQPRAVIATISGSKTYDGNATLSSGQYTTTFSNLAGSDTLGLSGLVQFNDKNAGSKTISVNDVSLTNNSYGNYVLSGAVSGSGTITPAALTISGLSADSRVYNGTTAVTLSGTASVMAIGNDVVTLNGSGTASFDNKNVGAAKLVTLNGGGYSLSGADSGNYVLVAPTGLSANITAAQLTISGLSAGSRVYNLDYDPVSGTYGRLATVSGGTLSGLASGDQVSIGSVNATFADKNVGTGKTVTVNNLPLSGADASNYIISSYPTLSANITPATLRLTLASHEYNNSTSGSFSSATLSGVLGIPQGASDSVTLVSSGATATYSDKNVGTAKTVTAGGTPLSLSGADAGNYAISTSVTGDITARPLATWIASTGGQWSNAANWADGVAPDGNNVLAASLGNGSGAMIYDASAGNTTLTTLTSDGMGLTVSGGKLTLTGSGSSASTMYGPLTLSGGSLDLQGRLTTSSLVLSSGTLYGSSSGSELLANSLSQTSGNIDSNGSVTISGGNIAVGNVKAHALTLNTGVGGVITETGQIVADTLNVSASGNVTLGNSNNHVGAFNAQDNGNITFFNTVTSGALALGPVSAHGTINIENHGSIHTAGDITVTGTGSNGGLVSITAHGPMTINNAINGNDIQLAASTDITLSGDSSLNSTHSIAMTAGNSISLGGFMSVPAGGSISGVATSGNISVANGTYISSGGSPVSLSAPNGSVSTTGGTFVGSTPTVTDGASAAADAAAKAAADAAAKAAEDAAAKAAADAAAKAAADAAAKAAADAAAKAAADAAAKAAADAAAKAAADAAAKAAADAAAKAAADAAAKAAADAAAKAAADAAAKAAADAAAAKAAADAAAAAAAGQRQGNQPVEQALNSMVNLIDNLAGLQHGGGGHSDPQTTASSVSCSGNSAPDDLVPDEKNADSTKESVMKMYCN